MTAATVVTGADAFLDAASIIRARGWIQHRYEDLDTGAVCVERALYLACYPSPGAADLVDDLPADVRAVAYDVVTCGGGFLNVDGEIPDPAAVIWEFNDREASEVDDVLALLALLARCAAKAQAAATAAVHRGGLNSDINALTASDRKAG